MPNGEHIRKMKQFCGCSRFVFNRTLAEHRQKREHDTKHSFNRIQANAELPKWKRELPWLKECNAQVLQSAIVDLERAFKNFFAKRANFPKFKRKVANLNNTITVSICRKSVGLDTATAAKLSVKLRT